MHIVPEVPKLYGDTDPRSGPSLETMVAQVTRRYPIDSLHELRRTLPWLKCDLNKFSADAWRAQLVKPPIPVNEHVVFPADFPKIGRRKRSQIPDQRIRAGINKDKTPEKQDAEVNKKLQKIKPTLPPLVFPQPSTAERDVGFEHFLETVPSPTHQRVTAGGKVVPAEPGSVSPVAANKTPFIPPHIAALEASPVLVQSNPGMPPVLYQPIASVTALGHQSYVPAPPAETVHMIDTQVLNSPPSGNDSVPARGLSIQHVTQPSNPAGINSTNPLMDLTNRPRVPYPEYEWERRLRLLQEHANRTYADMERNAGVDDERYGIRKAEYDAVLEEIARLSAAIRDSQRKRSKDLQEQSERSRLSRVNGTEVDSGIVKQNFDWWTNKLMTDCGAFLSHAESLHRTQFTDADLNEIQRLLGTTGLEDLNWLGTGDIIEQSPVSIPQPVQSPIIHHEAGNGFSNIVLSQQQDPVGHISNADSQSNVEGTLYHDAGSASTSKRPHMFGLDGGASSPDEAESNHPFSEDLSTELRGFPEMTSTFSGSTKVPRKKRTDTFNGQLAKNDKRRESYLETEYENVTSARKVKGKHRGGGDVVVGSAKENTRARGASENTQGGKNLFKAPPSVSSNLNSNLTSLSISSISKPNTELFDSSRYMRTIDSRGQVKIVLRTKSAEADLLKTKNKLQMKAMSAEYRDILNHPTVKNAKDEDFNQAFLNTMLKHPRFANADDQFLERFSKLLSKEVEMRRKRATSLASMIDDVEPSLKTNLGDYIQAKKNPDVYWESNTGCKTGILIDLEDSDDDKKAEEKPNPGPVLQDVKFIEEADKSNEEVVESNEADKSNEETDKSEEETDKSKEKVNKSKEEGDKATQEGDKTKEKDDKSKEEDVKSNMAARYREIAESLNQELTNQLNNYTKPDPDEVDAFFDNLMREEEEEIAKYRAENPL